MQDITYYTKLILSPEVQTLIDPYRNVFILISAFFIIISLFLIFKEKYYVSEIKRKIVDFLSNPKNYGKPRKFVALWNSVDKAFKKNDYEKMIIINDKLMVQILKRFGYVGDNSCSIFDDYGVEESGFPNIENVRRVSELSKAIQNSDHVDLKEEDMINIYNLSKDTLIKIGILNK